MHSNTRIVRVGRRRRPGERPAARRARCGCGRGCPGPGRAGPVSRSGRAAATARRSRRPAGGCRRAVPCRRAPTAARPRPPCSSSHVRPASVNSNRLRPSSSIDVTRPSSSRWASVGYTEPGARAPTPTRPLLELGDQLVPVHGPFGQQPQDADPDGATPGPVATGSPFSVAMLMHVSHSGASHEASLRIGCSNDTSLTQHRQPPCRTSRVRWPDGRHEGGDGRAVPGRAPARTGRGRAGRARRDPATPPRRATRRR